MSIGPWGIPIPMGPPRVLTPVDLDALEAKESELNVNTDTCKVCHIQYERPVAFHEFIPVSSSSSSNIENIDEVHEPPVVEEEGDLDSMPELEDENQSGYCRNSLVVNTPDKLRVKNQMSTRQYFQYLVQDFMKKSR